MTIENVTVDESYVIRAIENVTVDESYVIAATEKKLSTRHML